MRGTLGDVGLPLLEMIEDRVTIGSLETNRRNVDEGYSDITRKVKVGVPSFDEKIDATTFSNWLVAKEDYFDWHEMFDIERVRFTKMKLEGPARKFWYTSRVTGSQCVGLHQPMGRMKDRLTEKYLPSFHRTHLVLS